jgi:hypothetical protein
MQASSTRDGRDANINLRRFAEFFGTLTLRMEKRK